MKKMLFFLAVLCMAACKKENVYGPHSLRNGQEVELLVDHRYAADQDKLLILPEQFDAGASLVGFPEREPGYTYKVKARFSHNNNPPADGASDAFEFISVISRDQYQGTDSFTVPLIVAYVPGGPFIRINKTGNDYYLTQDKIQLTYTDPAVASQLEEIWQHALLMRTNGQAQPRPKWTAIKATVTHDPQKFGKAYLVQRLEFKQ